MQAPFLTNLNDLGKILACAGQGLSCLKKSLYIEQIRTLVEALQVVDSVGQKAPFHNVHLKLQGQVKKMCCPVCIRPDLLSSILAP